MIQTFNRVAPHAEPAPLADNERRVIQYGRQWIEHVSAGGAVRDGNILITD